MALPDGTALGAACASATSRRARGPEPRREPRAAGSRADRRTCCASVSPAALGGEAPGHVVGVTGPPGAGKSTLLSRARARRGARAGRTVAVLAVDPSSQALGRRAARRPRADRLRPRRRRRLHPLDRRRRAARRPRRRHARRRPRAGRRVRRRRRSRRSASGSPRPTSPRSPTPSRSSCSPASGDVLQFLKAGIMEIPDVLVVTKADLGDVALPRAARPPRRAALARRARRPPVVAVSSLAAAERHRRAGRGARRPPRGASTCRAPARARAARTRSPTSPPSTASAACARSAAGARRSSCLAEQPPGATCRPSSLRSRSRARREPPPSTCR